MNGGWIGTRRSFLGAAGAATAAACLGWPRRASWAVPTGPSESLRVVFYTDIHTRLEWDTPRALDLAARAINAQKPDLVLCGGDLITEGFQLSEEAVEPRWEAYLGHLHRAIESPVHAIVGNHDLVAAMPEDGGRALADPRAPFRRHLGVERTFGSFDAAGYHVIMLDVVDITRDEFKYRGWVGDDQLAWLKQDLAAVDTDTPVILMSHMPLLTSFYQATEGAEATAPRNRVVVNNKAVLDALAGHRLLAVLQGHLHVNEMLRWRDTTFITGGAVCGKWWRGPWQGTEEGFGVLTLRRDRVDWSYEDYGWDALRPATG